MTFLNNLVTINFHVIGDRTGNTYTGEFVVRKFLSHRQLLAKDQLLREYLKGDNLQISTQVSRADQLSTCQTALDKAPDWWKEANGGLDLIDDNVLVDLFEQVLKIQKEAEDAVRARAKTAAAPTKEAAKKPVDQG